MATISLRGIIPAIVNPMNSKYEIVLDDLKTYVEWLSKFRLGGLAVNVDTGEGPHLTDEERAQVIETVVSVLKGKIPIIAGVPPNSTAHAVKTAIVSRDAGADAFLVFPHPFSSVAHFHPLCRTNIIKRLLMLLKLQLYYFSFNRHSAAMILQQKY
jgi:4-hydroxy-tetrahydrodipicolinate synthase